MKHLFKTAICALLALPLTTACEMDQYPDGSLTEGQAWTEYADAQKCYVGLLSSIRSVSGGSNAYITDIQSDLFNERVASSSLTREHSWTFNSSQFAGDVIWSRNYSLVLQANYLLRNIGKIEEMDNLSDEQRTMISCYKGTAYFARAYAYCNLLPRYCKDYEPADGDNPGTGGELGLPLLANYGSPLKPARATLDETLKFVELTLDSAQAYMVDVYDDVNHPNTFTIDALRSRLCLYQHKFDEAISLSKNLVNNYSVVPGFKALQMMWVLDESSETIFQPLQTPDELATSYDIFVSFDIQTENLEAYINGMKSFYLPTQGLIDLFEPSDLRGQVYFNYPYMQSNPPISGVTPGTSVEGTVFYKFPGNQNLWKKGNEWYSKIYNMSKAFRGAEQYLICAESALRKSEPNLDLALHMLNELREARGASSLPDNLSKDELIKVMEEEWVREFVGEGFRLDCLKRWHKGFKRMEPQPFTDAILITTPGFTDLEVSADDPKWVWEIPSQDLQANPNLTPNWK